jgi:hypothetical protein
MKISMRHSLVVWVAALVLFPVPGFGAPKYGPDAKPLSAQTHSAYFRENPATDFWRLIPYYIPQSTPSGCSAANMTLLLNAARSHGPLTADDKLLTFESFARDYAGDADYTKAILGGKKALLTLMTKKPLANANLAKVLGNAARKLGISSSPAVQLRVIDQADRVRARADFEKALAENEKSSGDFIFFSYMQGRITGDPEGGAHVATVAAYDAKTKSVLVLDPDREWYEPYWTSVDALFEAIADPASDSRKESGWMVFRAR